MFQQTSVIHKLSQQQIQIDNTLSQESLQIFGDLTYGNLNFDQKLKTHLKLLKEQQYIDPDKLQQQITEETTQDEKNYKQNNIFICRVLKPEEPFKIIWDLIGMLFIFIQMLTVPLLITFSIQGDDGFQLFNDIMDYFFFCDMFFQFQTGYYQDGKFIHSRKLISCQYLKFWFWLDLVSTFPYDDVFSATDNQSNASQNTQLLKIIRIFRIIKIVRLIRALKLKKIINSIEDQLMLDKLITSIISFLKLCIIILCLSHWLACIWAAIMLNEDTDQNWYQQYIQNYQQQVQDQTDWFNCYLDGLYFSITTMITIGYGDISPKNSNEQLFGIAVMILASGVFGYTMNSIVSLFQNSDSTLEDLLNKNHQAVLYMKQKKLNKSLSSRIKNYLEWLIGDEQLQKGYAQNTLEKLSLSLKNLVSQIIYARMMLNIEFFNDNFTSNCQKRISFLFVEEIYNPEDWIINQTDQINEETSFYYILNGEVKICFPKTKNIIELVTLKKEQYFGEISFFANVPRSAGAKAQNFINLFRLSRKKFLEQCINEDLERFFQIKFQLEFEQNYYYLNIECYICKAKDHLAIYCPSVHYQINKLDRIKVIQKYNYDIQQNINELRLKKRKQNSFILMNQSINQIALKKIIAEQVEFEKYQNIKNLKQNSLKQFQIKDSFVSDSIKEYQSFDPDSNLQEKIKIQNENAELFTRNLLMSKNQQKQKFKDKYQQLTQQYQFQRMGQMALLNKAFLDENQPKNIQQEIPLQESNSSEHSYERSSSFRLKLLRQRQQSFKVLQQFQHQKLQRMRRNTNLGDNLDIVIKQKLSIVQELGQESPIQIVKKYQNENKDSQNQIEVTSQSQENQIILQDSNNNQKSQEQKNQKKRISFSVNQHEKKNSVCLGFYTNNVLQNMIYQVINHKLQNCK